ncbi:MAG: alpha/beta hydrolase [Acidimicrobiales bacterium]|nr:alpha/beta hydrolase [Acidimicrobiales bacterium]
MPGTRISSNHVDTPGLRIHYLQAGVGEPVVFLHGFPQTSHQWRHQLAALAERGYSCFAPDNRGFGGTDKPRVRISRGLLARDVARFMDAVGLESAHLVTHDWGGIIGFKVLADHPRRVRSMALLDTLCTVWHPRSHHGYWFKAEGLAEEFFARHHRTFIDVILGGRDGAALPGPPASPWSVGGGERGPLAGIDADALEHYRAAFADPDSHAAAISYYRYALPFHRIDTVAGPDGSTVEAPVALSEREVAELWLHPEGLTAHPGHAHFYDFGPEDRATRSTIPVQWQYSRPPRRGHQAASERVEAPRSNPFVEQFPRMFSDLEVHAVAAGHFLAEEAADYVTAELLRFLPLR